MNRKTYLSTAMLVPILMFSAMLQSVILTVSSDIPVPPEGSITIVDPLEDLVHIYTGMPADEYFDFIDVELVSLELTAVEPTLDCTITVRAIPPVATDKTVWYILMLDENNDPSDNSIDYPYVDIDTMYSVIYTKTGGWTIERAKYQPVSGWFVEPTDASMGVASSLPGGFSIEISIPLTELPDLAETTPWRVMTDTFTYPSTFPETGDFVPNEGLAYLRPTKIVVTNLYHGQKITGQTQTLTGAVLDPAISEVYYKVSSMIHEESGTVPVVDGSFSFDLELIEGINLVTLSDGTTEESLIFEVDTSAPLVSFIASDEMKNYTYFNWVNSFDIFTSGILFAPPFTYSFSDIVKQEKDKDGNLVYQEIVYNDTDGKKVGDEHTTWEYEATGQKYSKFRCKKITKTYTDKDGKPIKTVITEGEQVTEQDYDKGRIIKEVYKIPGIFGHKESTYEYDDEDRIKKKTMTFVDKDGKLVGKTVWQDYEYDDDKLVKVTRKHYDKSGKLIGKEVREYEYERKKMKKLTIEDYDVTDGKEIFKGTREFTYDYQGRKTIEHFVQKDKDGKVIWSHTREIKKTPTKTKIIYGKADNSTETNEYRFESDFPIFIEPATFTGGIVISDFGSNPTIPPVGTYTVMVTVDNSTGSYDDIFYIVGNSVDFNVTLSMNTTITITAIDEAGHIGVNTIQIPPPLVADIDCNNIVNILDITTVAIAFRSYPGHEKWDFFADVNNDDQVNIVDISMVAVDFGKTY